MIKGRFALRVDIARDGLPGVSQQFVSAPFHLSKPHLHNGILCLQAASVSPGVFPGDELAINLSVGSAAHCLFTTNSAQKAYATRLNNTPPARITQHLELEKNSVLYFVPKMLIPHQGARLRQGTTINIAPGAQLLFAEILAPGRASEKRPFSAGFLQTLLEVKYCGSLLLRDLMHLSPQSPSLLLLRQHHPPPFIGTLLLVSEKLEPHSHRHTLESVHLSLNSLSAPSLPLHAAASFLAPGCLFVRALCPGAHMLRCAFREILSCVQPLTGANYPELPL